MSNTVYPKSLSPEDKNALELFYKKAYPHRNDISEYLNRNIFSLPFCQIKDTLVIYDGDSIVGSNLSINTKALIGSEEYDVIWSFDTIVLPEYRSTDAGTFIGEFWFTHKEVFGAGLTDISERMWKVMKGKFIAYATAFIKLNYTSPYLFNFFKPILSNEKVLKKEFPELLNTKKSTFTKLSSAAEIKIPAEGYWNSEMIEFKRDVDFIKWRFFKHDSPYHVYQKNSDDCVYFVVRLIEWHNLPLLYMVDYRFNLNNTKDFNEILDAANKIVKKLNCAGLYIRCSLETLKDICKNHGFIMKGQGAQIVTRFKPAVKKDYPVFFTAADSDMDFK